MMNKEEIFEHTLCDTVANFVKVHFVDESTTEFEIVDKLGRKYNIERLYADEENGLYDMECIVKNHIIKDTYGIVRDRDMTKFVIYLRDIDDYSIRPASTNYVMSNIDFVGDGEMTIGKFLDSFYKKNRLDYTRLDVRIYRMVRSGSDYLDHRLYPLFQDWVRLDCTYNETPISKYFTNKELCDERFGHATLHNDWFDGDLRIYIDL